MTRREFSSRQCTSLRENVSSGRNTFGRGTRKGNGPGEIPGPFCSDRLTHWRRAGDQIVPAVWSVDCRPGLSVPSDSVAGLGPPGTVGITGPLRGIGAGRAGCIGIGGAGCTVGGGATSPDGGASWAASRGSAG